MIFYIFLLTWLTAFARYNGDLSVNSPRVKRDAAGALHIVTNHVQPIHADVKPENAGKEITEKVTPPEDAFYQAKSLRKSLIDQPSKVDLFRNIGRVITLAVLVISAVFEFYPLLKNLYNIVYNFIYL